MRKKVSLKDIAQKVGVSIALVSYVLNNQKLNRISKEVAVKIKEAAKELNYSTNHIAKSLKTNRTYTIGLVVADISNVFWASLARIIENAAEENNYTVLFVSSDENAERSNKVINVLMNHQVDGFIIAPPENSSCQITYLQENEIPFVLIDRYFPDIKTSYVAIDNYKATYEMVNHVVENGCKRIGLITFESLLNNLAERKRGYTTAINHITDKNKEKWIKEISSVNMQAEVEKAVDDLLSLPEPVEAIMFANNQISTFALKYIVNLPLKVPEDLALISFDEYDAADLFYAPLTYIKQPLQEMGRLATEILLEHIAKKTEITQVNLEPEFIIRKSSEKKPVSNKNRS